MSSIRCDPKWLILKFRTFSRSNAARCISSKVFNCSLILGLPCVLSCPYRFTWDQTTHFWLNFNCNSIANYFSPKFSIHLTLPSRCHRCIKCIRYFPSSLYWKSNDLKSGAAINCFQFQCCNVVVLSLLFAVLGLGFPCTFIQIILSDISHLNVIPSLEFLFGRSTTTRWLSFRRTFVSMAWLFLPLGACSNIAFNRTEGSAERTNDTQNRRKMKEIQILSPLKQQFVRFFLIELLPLWCAVHPIFRKIHASVWAWIESEKWENIEKLRPRTTERDVRRICSRTRNHSGRPIQFSCGNHFSDSIHLHFAAEPFSVPLSMQMKCCSLRTRNKRETPANHGVLDVERKTWRPVMLGSENEESKFATAKK